jgi:hypothetical protein
MAWKDNYSIFLVNHYSPFTINTIPAKSRHIIPKRSPAGSVSFQNSPQHVEVPPNIVGRHLMALLYTILSY